MEKSKAKLRNNDGKLKLLAVKARRVSYNKTFYDDINTEEWHYYSNPTEVVNFSND